MLSNTSKYAIRAVIYLALYAGEEKKIGIKEISKDLSIPTPFLGKIEKLERTLAAERPDMYRYFRGRTEQQCALKRPLRYRTGSGMLIQPQPL